VEGPHQLGPQALPERVGGHERFELGHHVGVPAEGELGLEPGLQRGDAQLLEARRLGDGERLVGEVGQGRAPPQAEGLP
jgi:hypothetical protein